MKQMVLKSARTCFLYNSLVALTGKSDRFNFKFHGNGELSKMGKKKGVKLGRDATALFIGSKS